MDLNIYLKLLSCIIFGGVMFLINANVRTDRLFKLITFYCGSFCLAFGFGLLVSILIS